METKTKKPKFHRFKRGQIVIVNFAKGIGYEMEGKHFAIVLSKNDSPSNGVVSVVPLTSKEKPYYVNLGKHIFNKAVLSLLKTNSIIESEIKIAEKSCKDLREASSEEEQQKYFDKALAETKAIEKRVNDFTELVDIYVTKNKNTYAAINNITTISKFRIDKPLNSIDPLKNMYLDDELLTILDLEIVKRFTGLKIKVEVESTKVNS